MPHLNLKKYISQLAQELGFLDVRVAKADQMVEEAERLKQWLYQGHHGEMNYMENHFEKRTDPRLLVPGAKSVVCLSYNYYNPQSQIDNEAPKISMYALGRDYHKVIRKKLKQILNAIKLIDSGIEGRGFVDSAPVLERDWAKRSGLGWTGKNTLTIHPKRGSYFFLAELILSCDLPPDDPIQDFCGTCTRCIDACPTDAIDREGYTMDGSRCISYLTIELKDDKLPAAFDGKMANYMYGCDICQEVCPWNRFSQPHSEVEFNPSDELLNMSKEDWQNLSQETFDQLFEGSAVKRTKFDGLKRNINFLYQSESPDTND